jgi:hypothetical protein
LQSKGKRRALGQGVKKKQRKIQQERNSKKQGKPLGRPRTKDPLEGKKKMEFIFTFSQKPLLLLQ